MAFDDVADGNGPDEDEEVLHVRRWCIDVLRNHYPDFYDTPIAWCIGKNEPTCPTLMPPLKLTGSVDDSFAYDLSGAFDEGFRWYYVRRATAVEAITWGCA